MLGKVPDEKGLVDGDVLDPHHAVVRELEDAVDQEHGIAVGHDLGDGVDVPEDALAVGNRGKIEAAGPALDVGQLLDESDVALVSGPPGHDVAAQRASQEGEVAQQVQDLVAHELVGKAQSLLVGHARLVDDDGVVERASLDHPRLAQPVHVALEHEGAGGSDLVGEHLGHHVEHRVLGPDERGGVLDGEGHAKAVVGKGHELGVPVLYPDRPRHREVPALGVLQGDAGLPQHPHVEGGAAVPGLPRFLGVEIDVQVVDAHPVHRGQQVLHGVDLGRPVAENGAAPVLGVVDGVLGGDGDLGLAGEIDAPEPDPGPGGGGTEPDPALDAGMEPHAFVGGFPGQGGLPFLHRIFSRSLSSSPIRSSRRFSCSNSEGSRR
jgi:hypothetical protein